MLTLLYGERKISLLEVYKNKNRIYLQFVLNIFYQDYQKKHNEDTMHVFNVLEKVAIHHSPLFIQ